jgi:hypothetical protein
MPGGTKMDFDTFQVMNSIYEPLYKRTLKILNELKKLNYDVVWGYYGFHSIRRNNELDMEFFPIPVITVKDICEIGVDLDHIFIEGKLGREAAIKFDYSLLQDYLIQDYSFEVYGIDDYLNDFYNKNLDIAGISNRIKKSIEKEVGISINLEHNNPISSVIEIVKKYSELDTYIL